MLGKLKDQEREIFPGRGFDLTGQVALTGSGSTGGIGHACALGLAVAGAHVVANSRSESTCKRTSKEIRKIGRKSIAVAADISKADQISKLFERIDKEFGRLDILVNNVGFAIIEHPEDLSLSDWNSVIALNLTGSFLCCQAAARRMIKNKKGGSIVNISSIAGASALGRGNLVYSVTKAGINSMTRELAVEWAHHGIRVNAVLPAQIRTPMMGRLLERPDFDSEKLVNDFLRGIPLNRLGESVDIASPVVFLASDAAAFVTGSLLPVDGGNLALNAGGHHTWPAVESTAAGN